MPRIQTRPVPEWLPLLVKEHINAIDPIGLRKQTGSDDQYDQECSDISTRIVNTDSAIQIQTIIFAVFVYHFELQDALPATKYGLAAKAISNGIKEKMGR